MTQKIDGFRIEKKILPDGTEEVTLVADTESKKKEPTKKTLPKSN